MQCLHKCQGGGGNVSRSGGLESNEEVARCLGEREDGGREKSSEGRGPFMVEVEH